MSAREEILARARAALADVTPDTEPVITPRTSPEPGTDLVALFTERVEDYRAVVLRCSPDDVEEAVRRSLPAEGEIVVPADLGLHVDRAVVDDGFTAAQLDATAGVVTRSSVGIALTGTVVLDHGPGQGRRAISLVPDIHVCLIDEAQIVYDVPDAMDRLAAPVADGRPLTWISGPSATSDIELSRVEGVHGPRSLVVIIVG